MSVRTRSDPRTVRRAPELGRASRHGPIAQLLIAWSPLSVILLAYGVAGWISRPLDPDQGRGDTNRLGFGLHTTGPADADRRLFGVLPTAWLQEHLVDGSSHWYDAVAAVVYITHFVTIPLLTAVVWFALRHRFRAWLTTVVTFTVLGIGGYVVYPAAPPWLTFGAGAADTGEPVRRISDLGWEQLHLTPVGDLMGLAQGISNPVAAMPSLHAGAALLVALFVWPSVRPVWRAVLLGYAVLMALTLVYTGEHYVVDVLAGWATALVAILVGRAAQSVVASARLARRASSSPPRS